MSWFHGLELDSLDRETLDEYFIHYQNHKDRLASFDQRIEKLADLKVYRANVKRLTCSLGIKTHSRLALLVEGGDFHRFKRAEAFASYPGFVPREHSSNDRVKRLGIMKAGNTTCTVY